MQHLYIVKLINVQIIMALNTLVGEYLLQNLSPIAIPIQNQKKTEEEIALDDLLLKARI